MNKTEMTIKDEQSLQLQILKWFNNICKQESLTFYLAYGTLLGAIRDHGFIDWDDDVDLWMPRSDYEKFSRVYRKYKIGDYFLQTYQTDPHCVSPEMMRICVNGTYKWPEGCEREKFHTGLFFDIFPLDYGFGDDQDQLDLEYSTKLHKSIWKTLRVKRKHTLKGIVHEMLSRLLPRDKYIKKYVNLVKSHSTCKSDVLLVFAASFAGNRRSVFAKKYFEEVEWVSFEDISLPVPKKSDELLTYMYGEDYLTPIKTKPHRTVAYFVK